MPKNTVTDPITDQEMAFAHLILSGTMTDRRAAQAVGLNPETRRLYQSQAPRSRLHDRAPRRRQGKAGGPGSRRAAQALQNIPLTSLG